MNLGQAGWGKLAVEEGRGRSMFERQWKAEGRGRAGGGGGTQREGFLTRGDNEESGFLWAEGGKRRGGGEDLIPGDSECKSGAVCEWFNSQLSDRWAL